MSTKCLTVCQRCDLVCHDGCGLGVGCDAVHCATMTDGRCTSCPDGCGHQHHRVVDVASTTWRAEARAYRISIGLNASVSSVGSAQRPLTSSAPSSSSSLSLLRTTLSPAAFNLASSCGMVPWLQFNQWFLNSSVTTELWWTTSTIVCPPALEDALSAYFNTADDGAPDLCPLHVDLDLAPTTGVRHGTGLRSTNIPFYFMFHIQMEYGGSSMGLQVRQITCRQIKMAPVLIGRQRYTPVCLERCIIVTQKQAAGEIMLFAMTAYEFARGNGITRNDGRVYVSYLDSTEFFDKSQLPTSAGQPNVRARFAKELILDAYANYVSALGFFKLHLWSAAPRPNQAFYLLPRRADKTDVTWADKQKKLDAFYRTAFVTGYRNETDPKPGERPPRWRDAQGPQPQGSESLELEFPLFPGDFKLQAFTQNTKPVPCSRFIVDLRDGKYGWYGKYYEQLQKIDVGPYKQLLKEGSYNTVAEAAASTQKLLDACRSKSSLIK